eukprot:3930625-Rhodomonas_salina.1
MLLAVLLAMMAAKRFLELEENSGSLRATGLPPMSTKNSSGHPKRARCETRCELGHRFVCPMR